jgi:hypothetical protein
VAELTPIRNAEVRERKCAEEKGVRKEGLVCKSRITTNNRVADYEEEGKR